jgi:hypothetical protein
MPARRLYSDGFIVVNGAKMEVMIDTEAPYGKCLVPTLQGIDSSDLYVRRRKKDGHRGVQGMEEFDTSSKDSCSTSRSTSSASICESGSSHRQIRQLDMEVAETALEPRRGLSDRAKLVSAAFFELRAFGCVSSETKRRLDARS